MKFRIVWNRDLWGNSLPRLLCENATGAGTLVSDMEPAVMFAGHIRSPFRNILNPKLLQETDIDSG